MDVAPATSAGGGGGGGPAPFLLKTYDMIDDLSSNEIVSWNPNSKNSFVVWNPPEFARLLLPAYFKHNNFSSFIRQLNTYGFRKSDPERWEFTNEDFVKDQKHLLRNIHRRKPIHSHSHHPQGSSTVDPERATFEEEIDRLLREKATLEANVSRFKQQHSAAKLHLQDMTLRVSNMEKRQENLLVFLEKATQDPDFVEHLSRKLDSLDFSAYNKKRRLPPVDQPQMVPENCFVDNHSSSRPDFGNAFHQDLSNKLRLELSPAVSDINFVSHSTQSSNEDGGSPLKRLSEGCTKNINMRTNGLLFAPEPLELSDTGTSLMLAMDSSSSQKAEAISQSLHCLQKNLATNEEAEGNISCQLNLSLASSSLQVNKNQIGQGVGRSLDSRSNGSGNEPEFISSKNQGLSGKEGVFPPPKEGMANNQGPGAAAAAQVRVNDVFWEQFLTERPGSSDTEDSSSSFRANSFDEHEDRRPGHGIFRNGRSMEHLSL